MEINIRIKTLEEWKKYFPPAGGDKQWKDGYSALELAKIVTGAYENLDFEKELQKQIGKELGYFSLNKDEIYPERLSKFDNDWHGPRHHDLACVAVRENKEKVALCFEAKVFESLDIILKEYVKKSIGKKTRCNKLCQYFFDQNYDENKFGYVYYQILSSIAGTIAFASEKNIKDAFFILYQIIPSENNDEINNKDKHIESHKNALKEFLKCKGVEKPIIESGKIFNLGEMAIEREDEEGKQMKANISIMYLEQKVSGKSINGTKKNPR